MTGLIVGVGASRRATVDEVVGAVRTALTRVGPSADLLCLATAYDIGGDGVVDGAALELGVPVRRCHVDLLGEAVVPNASPTVTSHRGVPSIAEAAVVASGASLLVAKQKHGLVTVAIGTVATGTVSIGTVANGWTKPGGQA